MKRTIFSAVILSLVCLFFAQGYLNLFHTGGLGVAWAKKEQKKGAKSGSNEPDPWFPRKRSGPNGTIIFYAPQIDSWKDFKVIEVWQAFLATPKGEKRGYYGSLHYKANTEVDIDKREVLLSNVKILELSIPKLPKDSPLFKIVKKGLTAAPVVVPLDLVLEYLPEDMEIPSVKGLNPKPPKIFYSTKPALLLFVDGKPIWVPIEKTGIEFLINTNWDLLREKGKEKGPYYLRYNTNWLTSNSFKGPWTWAKSLPKGLKKLPKDKNWKAVHNALPKDLDKIEPPKGPVPKVFYTDEPAELILFDGPPKWEPIGKTGLQYGVNTKEEVFKLNDKYYVLFSGRWFEAKDLSGPWKWTTKLPKAFLNIPKDHKKAYVRKNVPGTREAWEAALLASIPRRATVSKKASNLAPKVEYVGEPIFKPIEGTKVAMAVNTKYQVLRYKGKYYLCYNAIWFESNDPKGPWVLTESIPAEFSKIPPTSPAYNTTFVKIADSTDENVTYTYTPGYEGSYVVHTTVVYGTGWWHPWHWYWDDYDYYYPYPYYPYYPYPPTYNHGSWYDPETGRFGRSVVGYGAYGNAGVAAVFNPKTGTYARGAAVWEDDEYRTKGLAFNPNTNTQTFSNRYLDLENKEGWSERLTTRGDEWRYRKSEWEDGRLKSEFETSYGTKGEIYRQKDGNTLKSQGTISYKGKEMEFQSTRERQGDKLVNKGTITGENRSAQFESEWKNGQGNIEVRGSEGGTGSIKREVGGGEITGSGTFTKGDTTLKTEMKRTAEGVVRKYESNTGSKGATFKQGDTRSFIAETSGGDIYAGRDGNVYKKTDNGWTKVENPGGKAWALGKERSARSNSKSEFLKKRYGDRSARATRDRSRSINRQRLNRDYKSRHRGFQRFKARRSSMGRARAGGFRGRRR